MMRCLQTIYKLVGASLGVALGLLTSLPGAESWFEPFDGDGSLLCRGTTVSGGSAAPPQACLEAFRDEGKGSYEVRGGELLATFGPCPHLGRSLYVWPRAIFAGDIEVGVVARLPALGKLFVFAHGDNRSGGYRGLLFPDGRLELERLDYRGESTIAATTYVPEMARFAGMASVHLRLRTAGDQVALAAWTEGAMAYDDLIQVTDVTFRSGNAGAGVKEPGYGEVAAFDALRITYGWPRDRRPSFVRGDANADGSVGIADAVRILGWLVMGSEDLPCLAGADANADGAVDISDAIALLDYFFLGGAPPRTPFPGCGPAEPTEIDCAQPSPACD